MATRWSSIQGKALGQPGSRAPHVELAPGRSTLDLFGLGFVLLTGDSGQRWQQAAAAAARGDSR